MIKKPKFPPNAFRLEGLFAPTKLCKCGSSLKRKGCIQPNCMNYYKGWPNKDYNPSAAVYDLNGKLQYD